MTVLVKARKPELGVLYERHRVERLALFGSALRDDFDPERGDLEFSVEFPPMAPQEHAESYFGLLDGWGDLFGRRVDLVEVHALRNPYLRREIEEEQETLYAAAQPGSLFVTHSQLLRGDPRARARKRPYRPRAEPDAAAGGRA